MQAWVLTVNLREESTSCVFYLMEAVGGAWLMVSSKTPSCTYLNLSVLLTSHLLWFWPSFFLLDHGFCAPTGHTWTVPVTFLLDFLEDMGTTPLVLYSKVFMDSGIRRRASLLGTLFCLSWPVWWNSLETQEGWSYLSCRAEWLENLLCAGETSECKDWGISIRGRHLSLTSESLLSGRKREEA